MTWLTRFFHRHIAAPVQPDPRHLAAERAVVLDVYRKARERGDTRAQAVALDQARSATILELRAHVRGGR